MITLYHHPKSRSTRFIFLLEELLTELLSAGDRARAARVMQVMMNMAKLDIAALRDA